jgi:hypothetical protein
VLLHSHWVAGGEKGPKPRCKWGPNPHCKECMRWSKKCLFMQMKPKDLKRGAKDDKVPKQVPR